MEKFTEQLKGLSNRIENLKDTINTEEATKTALIMPFFQILGYDVFNPLEFTPEFTADVGIKKGEKVDYAILYGENPIILIECKSVNEKLDNHDSQLFRYFVTTSSKFGILTNGIEYRFYTDLDEQNKMDSTPFLQFNLLELKENHIIEIFKFTKDNFEISKISKTAYELKYVNSLKDYLTQQWNEPSELFVKYLLNEIYDGVKTKQVIERFTPIVKKTFRTFINEQVNNKLNAALNTTVNTKHDEHEENIDNINNDVEIITTPEELEAYAIAKVLLKDTIDVNRVFYRDNQSYFNILLDDNIRKWIVRIYMNRSRKYIELNNGKKEKIEISIPMDLTKYKNELIEVVKQFL
ncbi:type I restriction enzyme HsdR protein [Gemella bergeri ATCC 700627]|uniref:Type I restriction enzyme HsdR protein n=1 Tax=Gemella bergeri ATCC 700627 TaxID=1321820 RepID=U2S4P7_9BACL|nr:type I restriction endonuclease [Gemella bergeri]ERK57762.1 type I restriction enzyme HsdR protein [Gemella bergeri ATCC 700627]